MKETEGSCLSSSLLTIGGTMPGKGGRRPPSWPIDEEDLMSQDGEDLLDPRDETDSLILAELFSYKLPDISIDQLGQLKDRVEDEYALRRRSRFRLEK